jgi:hypothetical protein
MVGRQQVIFEDRPARHDDLAAVFPADEAVRSGTGPHRQPAFRPIDQQEGIAVHRRRDVGEHLDRIPNLTHGGEHVHRHALRRRAGEGGLLALRTLRDTLRAQVARVHEEHEGLGVAGQKGLAFDVGQGPVGAGAPGATGCGIRGNLLEVNGEGALVLAEELAAVLDAQCVRRAGRRPTVMGAAELAFHPHPLRDDDLARIEPPVIRERVPSQDRLDGGRSPSRSLQVDEICLKRAAASTGVRADAVGQQPACAPTFRAGLLFAAASVRSAAAQEVQNGGWEAVISLSSCRERKRTGSPSSVRHRMVRLRMLSPGISGVSRARS